MQADQDMSQAGPKEISYLYTERDFVDAYRLQTRAGWKSYFALLAVFAAVAIFVFSEVPEWEWRLGILGLSALGGLAVFCVAYFWYYPRIPRRQFRVQPLAHSPRTIALTDAGVRFSFERGASELRWSDFIAWRADERSIILFTAPRIFIVVPTRLADLGFPVDELKGALARDFAMRKPGGP